MALHLCIALEVRKKKKEEGLSVTSSVRAALQDRCREIVELETKIKEQEEHTQNLRTETAMRAVELEAQRQQMSVLWDLGSKVVFISVISSTVLQRAPS